MTSDQVQAGSHILGIVGVIYRYSDPWIVVESAGDLTTAPWCEWPFCPILRHKCVIPYLSLVDS
jgi:hypothetical protein